MNNITVEGEKIDKIRWNLTGLEGKCTELYLKQYITFFPKYLQARALMRHLDGFFESKVEVPRMKMGNRQAIETLVNEEALLLAKFLRNESKTWNPRIVWGVN